MPANLNNEKPGAHGRAAGAMKETYHVLLRQEHASTQ
jgi:hypothetical protein